jgi:hypothetical protein
MAHSIRMVNDGFPRRRAYGFGGDPHQSKIYAESNQSDFSRIFAELISMQTLAIYRALLVRESMARDQAQRLRGLATG